MDPADGQLMEPGKLADSLPLGADELTAGILRESLRQDRIDVGSLNVSLFRPGRVGGDV
jgi:hypothetical protein